MRHKQRLTISHRLSFILFVFLFSGCSILNIKDNKTETVRAETDVRIAELVRKKLALSPEFASCDVAVDSLRGIVTLKGIVHSPDIFERAIVEARTVPGVKDIVAQIIIDQKSS